MPNPCHPGLVDQSTAYDLVVTRVEFPSRTHSKIQIVVIYHYKLTTYLTVLLSASFVSHTNRYAAPQGSLDGISYICFLPPKQRPPLSMTRLQVRQPGHNLLQIPQRNGDREVHRREDEGSKEVPADGDCSEEERAGGLCESASELALDLHGDTYNLTIMSPIHLPLGNIEEGTSDAATRRSDAGEEQDIDEVRAERADEEVEHEDGKGDPVKT